jgi:hypothetical protein
LLLGFVGCQLSMLADPPYADSLWYSDHVRLFEQHRFHFAAYAGHAELRPPLFLVATAVLRGLVGETRFANHAIILLAAIATLIAVERLARRLGATAPIALWAAAACALNPAFFAQTQLYLMDLPTGAFVAWAWLALLEGRLARYVVLAGCALVTKESAWFILMPAAGWVWHGKRRMMSVAIALSPGFFYVAWFLVHRLLTGVWVAPIHRAAVGLPWLAGSVLYDFVDGGRLLLWPLALLAARRAGLRSATTLTALATAGFCLCFPAPLPRYGMPSLPLLVAVAAAGLSALTSARMRRTLAVAILATFVVLWSCFDRGTEGGPLDVSLRYRRLLAFHRQAAVHLAARGAKAVLATTPMSVVIAAPPEDGYLATPIAVDYPGDLSAEFLCRHDFLVENQAGNSIATTREALESGKALTLDFVAGDTDPQYDVRIWKIGCPGR